MREHSAPMTVHEVYEAIVARGLYEFHAQDPRHVVVQQIRRHADGIDFPSANPRKHFKLVGENRFLPLDSPVVSRRKAKSDGPRKTAPQAKETSLSSSLREMKTLHQRYVRQ